MRVEGSVMFRQLSNRPPPKIKPHGQSLGIVLLVSASGLLATVARVLTLRPV